MNIRATVVIGVALLAPAASRQAPASAALRHPPALTITREARAVQPGELVVLTIAATAPASTMTATAFARDLQPFQIEDTKWRVLVGIDLDTPAGRHLVTVRAPLGGVMVEETYALTVAAKRFPTRRLTVEDRYVEPPPDVVVRIQEEAALLTATWAASSPERLWDGPFIRPVAEASNSAFGSRSVFNGQARAPHGGADFLSPKGTPVAAPNGGRVLVARDLYFTGNTVVVDHGLGLLSLFAHLSRIDVREGDRVKASDVLGLVGATGRVTGPHLHWTLRAGGARVDPLSLLAVLGNKQ